MAILLVSPSELNAQINWDWVLRSYLSVAAAAAVHAERNDLLLTRDEVNRTRTEVIRSNVLSGVIRNSKVNFPTSVPLIITPFDPAIVNLCNDFWNPLSTERQRCIEKRDYLIECSQIIDEVFRAGTGFPLTRGQRDLIMHQYHEIAAMLNSEVEKMQIERDKRGFARRVFD